jgi:hypothetical protein
MFFLNQKKAKITSFEIRGDKLLYLSDKNLYVDSILLRGQDVCCFVRGLKERIIFSSWDSVIYTFTNNKIISLLEGYSLSEKKYSEDKIIISQRVSRGVFNKFVFDLSTGSILKKIDAEPSFISLSSEIFTIATTLKSLSLLTGEYEWEVDLGAYGEIDKIIGVCNEVLWVGVGSKMLIGIDIKYGKIMHIIDKPSHFAYQSGAFNYFRGHDGQIDEKAKKIVGFEFDTYYELDLVTMEFTYWIFREEAKAMKIEARYAPQNIHLEDFIYFIDKLNFKIGIFDRKNKTIKEAYVFPENSCTGFLNDLQVTNDKMYVLDTGGTLHIFGYCYRSVGTLDS